MTNKITSGAHTFELVEYVPENYEIWNIGAHMINGYLPLAEVEGNQVNPDTLKAIKIDGAQTILKAIGRGQKTIQDMERYVKRYDSSKTERIIRHVQNLRSALEVMYTIKWGETARPEELETEIPEKEETEILTVETSYNEEKTVMANKEENITFYAFNPNDQSLTKVVRCSIAMAHQLFNNEREKMENGISDYTYIDITSTTTGALCKSYCIDRQR